MFRTQLPRIYELLDLVVDPRPSDVYSNGFENFFRNSPHARQQYRSLEKELQGLDETAWAALKTEASPYLMRKDKKGRGWQQLFDILGQARAYNYLEGTGCSSVSFIPRSDRLGARTPDLRGFRDSDEVLCEVKTLNCSQDEVRARKEFTARSINRELGDGFFLKLRSNISEAQDQLHKYDPQNQAKHCVYLNLCFDDFFGNYKEDYFQQIERYLRENFPPGTEVVLRDDMSSKTVVVERLRAVLS
jgi:hypothetical protein